MYVWYTYIKKNYTCLSIQCKLKFNIVFFYSFSRVVFVIMLLDKCFFPTKKFKHAINNTFFNLVIFGRFCF